MKRKYLLALSLIGITVLGGCSSQTNPTASNESVQESTVIAATVVEDNQADAAEQVTTEEVDRTTSEGTEADSSIVAEDYALYKSVLDEAYGIVSGENFDVIADDNTIGLLESCGEDTAKSLADIGYVLMDIDANGVNELLLANNADGDSRILAIYTLNGETPVFVAGGWIRNKLYLLGQNNILNIGSGGADYTYYMVSSLDENTNSLLPTESYFTDFNDSSKTQLGWFHNNTGSLEPSESEWLGEITDGQLLPEAEQLYKNHVDLDLSYFKDYQK